MFKRFLKGLLAVGLVAVLGFTSGYYSDKVLNKIIPSEKGSGFGKYLQNIFDRKNDGQQQNPQETGPEPGQPADGGETEGVSPDSGSGGEDAVVYGQAPELREADLELGGLKIGDNRRRVEETLGQGVKVHKSYDPEIRQNVRTFESARLTVEWGKKTGVFAIIAASPGVATARGLQVGDPLEKAYQLYGKPASEQGGMAVYKYTGSGVEALFIKSVSNKIVEIKTAMKKSS